jgi:amino acid adenylation domain-containing protein
LGVEPIGIHDNFFALGGDSIRSIRVLTRAKAQGIHFSLQSLFQYPTIYELTQHLETEEGLELLRRPFSLVKPADRLKLPAGIEDAYPVAKMQAGMIFHSEFSPETAVYHDIATYHLRAPLDLQSLQSTIEMLVQRHPVLRTSFELVSYSEPLQLVHQQVPVVLGVEDFRHLSDEAQAEGINGLIEAEKVRGIDLHTAPLLRVLVCRRSEHSFQLTLSFHHAILDGWSVATLLTELLQHFWFVIGKHQQDIAPPPNSLFRDFVALERKTLGSEVSRQYWVEKLADSIVTSLPRRLQPSESRSEGDVELRTIAISGTRFDGLKDLARLANAPLKSVLLAAHIRVLALLSGQSDVMTGLVSNGRPEEEDGERVLGLFLNTLPFRQQLKGGTWIDLVRETFALEREMLEHRRYPLAELQQIAGGRSLFEVVFNFVHFHVYQSLGGLREIGFLGGQFVERTNFPLFVQFSLDVQASKVTISLKYDASQFSLEQIDSICGYYERTVAAMTGDPASRYECAELLGEQERQRLLEQWNDTNASYPKETCIHELFQSRVSAMPEKVAVVHGDERLTFAELNQRANQLARHLRYSGVEPGSPVGICIQPSADMVVGLLAILKAGGCYIPLDPSYPRQRLSLILKDAAAPFLLTRSELLESLPESAAQVICFDNERDAINAESSDDLALAVSALSPAYVIYTSGSTGQPKGVQISHRAVVNFLTSMSREPGLDHDDVLLAVTSLSFDIAGLEIYLPLLVGARLVLTSRETAMDGALLLSELQKSGATVMQATPVTWRLLVAAGWQGGTPYKVLCGGEMLPADLAQELTKRSREVWNLYGPTETTIWSTIQRLDNSGITIGRPIANTQVYLLDGHLQPVPLGVPGHLYIGGDGLAIAYLNRPALTAEKFVPNPFRSDSAEDRLYKTGDRARYLPNGEIEYLGRLDQQIKLRGFRIELGDIEAVLTADEALREAVVVARETGSGDRQLVAYVVRESERAIASGDSAADESRNEQVAQWANVWDETYGQTPAQPDHTFNTIGWNSSYSGLPIPATEMRSWAEDTVSRILALSPRRVLEIGCGTGMLLFRIAPQTEQYHATDVSQRALNYIAQNLDDRHHVTLSQRPADDFEGLTTGSFDTVILNSVVQYFPDVNYLASVLTSAVKTVGRGSVFVGDIRNLRLLEAFHTSIVLAGSSETMTAADCRRMVQERIYREEELFIDPDFFHALRQQLPEITSVEIQLKQGTYHNELTRFRYDVILHIAEERPSGSDTQQLDWQTDGLSLASLRRLLKETAPQVLKVTRVPNLRVLQELEAAKRLSDNPSLTVGEIKTAFTTAGAVDPENLWALAESGYHVTISWSETVDCFDVLFSRDASIRDVEPSTTLSFKSLRDFVNDPLQGLFARKIGPSLRTYLKDNLPEYMVPSTFVLLDKLPLTPNGKIDRRALPEPVFATSARASTFIAPRTPTEEMVAGIWMRVLGVEQLSVADNFFELGGHSLLATQIVTRVRASFKIDLPLRLLFEKPTVAALAVEIERVVREGHGVSAPPIERVPATDDVPLSFAQQRLWFLDQLTPDNPFYNMQLAIRLNGELSVASLTAALNEICRRHEVFRTSFRNVSGDPVQRVSAPQAFALQLFDLSTLSDDPLEEVAQRARAEAQRPFNLSVAPLVRFSLFKTAERDYVLLTTMHHIISDGWSLSVFMGELAILYRSYCEHKASPLPELPIQYSDFARWQTDWLRGDVLNQHLDYWKKQLGGIPPTVELRTDRPRPALPTYRGARHVFTVKKKVFEGLRSMSKAEGMTLFMTLLAAWLTLLSRYSGQEDICVGTPMANRNQPETEGLIGFFVDTLLLRGDLSGNPTFRTLMSRVRETALGAYAHQNIPFEKLVDELHPQRDTSRNPLFQVMFTVNKASDTKLDIPGITISPASFGANSTRFDLECQFTDTTHELKGAITYSLDLFDATTIQRLVDNLQVLLAIIVDNPDQPLSVLPLLTPAEERRLVSEWNQTSTAYETEKCAPALFEEQAAKTPENIAAVFADVTLSYRDLNARANKLAHYLRAAGVGPEVPVAICLERSLGELIAVLGVLKAGGVYVPLDPAFPADRISFMIEDSRSRILLTEQTLAQRLPASAARLICLDTDWELIEDQPGQNLNAGVSAENLAYLIYTSGSTGTPKGTMISHRGLRNYLSWATRAYAVSEGNGAPLHSSLSFDLTVTSLFAPLLAGRSVTLVKDGLDNLKSALEAKNAFSFVKLTPSHLDALVALLSGSDASGSTHTLIIGGEALAGQSVAAWLDLAPATRIINEYGPTETVVGCCVYEVNAETDLEHSVPIGKPVANTKLYILDRAMQLTPMGVAGELYIAGDGLARGYCNRPELTAAGFVPNPFSGTPGARMYRTGDVARYRNNGDIEFLDRIDRQIKLHGYRIEPGEIESVLSREPEVREAVVMAREDHAGEKRLVAYVVTDSKSVERESWTASLKHVENWQILYDQLYKRSETENGLKFAGWNSSYSGAPIPDGQMVEWRDATVERIRELKPRRVLEIGCGTGLLLTQLAPECEAYWGTDFSQAPLDYLRRQVTQLRGVHLLHRRANDFSDLPENYFDTIILNSVVQYFPGVDYLMEILESALQILAPGGTIFIGDVRNLQLLEPFHLSVQLWRAGGETDAEELRRRLRRAVRWDNELLIHPQLFMSLRDRSRVNEVDIHLKRGATDSEMTRFRYDVVLRTGKRARDVECQQLDWHVGVNLSEIARKLNEERPESLRIEGVLNARVAGEVAALELLKDRQSRVKADELKQLITSRASEGILPEEWWQLGDEAGYEGKVCWSDRASGSCYDVWYRRGGGKSQGNGHDAWTIPGHNLADLASNPFRPLLEQKLIQHLHGVLRDKLAAYMVPAEIVILDEIPLTQNGKIDWQALPPPEDGSEDPRTSTVAPRDAVELRLTKLWNDVLHVRSISVTDNFFDLGGNSMAAVRLMTRVQKEFGKQLPLSVLFQRGTVEYLAGLLRQESASLSSSPLVELQPEGTKPPFFFVHAAGGTVFSYLKLAQRLGHDQPSYGIQSLNLINEQPNELTIEEMAAAYVRSIIEKEPEGPYFIGGWSFGGVVAFEVARRLAERGRHVAMLVLIDSRASARVSDDTAHDGSLASAFARDIGVDLDSVSLAEALTPDEQLQRILTHAKRTNALPSDTDFEQILRFYNVYRANMIAWSRYRPQTYSGRVILYRAADRQLEAYFDPKLGWIDFVTGEIEVQTIPGGHYTLLTEPGVDLLASALKNSLE